MTLKKASGYIRTATGDRNAVDEQKRNIENAAFANDYQLTEIYTDTGNGGSLERRGIRELLNDAKNNNIETVIVNSLDELSTGDENSTELLVAFSGLNVGVYSVRDKKFLNTPLDTLNNLSR